MKSVHFGVLALTAVFAVSLSVGVVNADWSEDFSAPLTNWDEYQFDIGQAAGIGDAISTEVSGGKLIFDAHLPDPNTPFLGHGGYNQAAGYSALILDDPAFPDAEDVEISCVIELDGTTEHLYAGVLARAQGIQMNPNPSIVLIDGVAYAYLISGYDYPERDGYAEAGLYKVYDNDSHGLVFDRLGESFDQRVDDEPMYMKMKVTTNEFGQPHIEAMMSFDSNFSDPFGVIDYVDTGDSGSPIVGAGGVGLIGFNQSDPTPAEPASATFDDLLVVTQFVNLGDANGDGFVNSADLDIVRGNWGTSVTPGSAASGDLSGDGLVNSSDLDLVRGNWGTVYAAAVPEPGICVLLALGLMAFAFRIRRS